MPPTPPPHKSVTFCAHCNHDKRTRNIPRDVRYYSDPGRDQPKPTEKKKPKDNRRVSADNDIKYYSEPDAKYFEIDYGFLKELRRIARSNCPKCKRRRSRKEHEKYQSRLKDKSKARTAGRENYIYCNGRYHSNREHCRFCCKICNRSTDTLDSIDDDIYSTVSRSYTTSSKTTNSSRSKSTPRHNSNSGGRERKNSVQSVKSVSFLESSADEPNYTAKSFTNDLKKFLLKPTTPRFSFRDKLITSLKQEFDATKMSPKLKAIKGLWKSY